jgi:hypothetical protein
MAAGLGFKTFTTGEVLTAADTNGYLMQGVLVFADATARDAAITSPQEGQFAYLKDTNVTTYYTGSAWANLDTTGMTNPMTTTGDTIYSSSGSTPARLGIGSTGQVLTVAGGVPAWSAPAGGSPTTATATVAANETTVSTSFTNLTTTGPEVTITTGTKALVIVTANFSNDTLDQNSYMDFEISGATSRSASTTTVLTVSAAGNNRPFIRASCANLMTVTAGSNTFTAKYRVTGGTGRFLDRTIFVMDLG